MTGGAAITFHVRRLDLFSLWKVSLLTRQSAFRSANKEELEMLNIHSSECLKENLNAALTFPPFSKIAVTQTPVGGLHTHVLQPKIHDVNLKRISRNL